MMRWVCLFVLALLCPWQSVMAQRAYWPKPIARDSVPQRRNTPLRFVAVDSTQLIDFFIDRMRRHALELMPGPALRPYEATPAVPTLWKAQWQNWSRRVHDSINVVGALGDAERDPAVLSAAQTVEQGLNMYLHSGQADVFDAVELALYNGVASGMYGIANFEEAMVAGYWALQAPNLLMATDGDSTLYINLYAATDGTFTIGKRKVSLYVDTSMPWSGLCKVSVQVLEGDPKMRLALRLPLWARGIAYNNAYKIKSNNTSARVTIDEMPQMSKQENGYIVLDRDWSKETLVVLDLAMPVQYWSKNTADTTAFVPQLLRRGPLTYAFWQPQGDNFFSDRTRIHWQFDLKHYDAFVLFTSLYTQPPKYTIGEQGDTACYLMPYHTILKDHVRPLQLWTHEGRTRE